MKNKQNIVYRVVVGLLLPLVIAVAGLTLAGCPQEPESTHDIFEGTWVQTQPQDNRIKFVAKNGSFTQYNYDDDTLTYKGTYTVSENTVTFTYTHKYENNAWETFTSAGINQGYITGNTFTRPQGTILFTKQ